MAYSRDDTRRITLGIFIKIYLYEPIGIIKNYIYLISIASIISNKFPHRNQNVDFQYEASP